MPDRSASSVLRVPGDLNWRSCDRVHNAVLALLNQGAQERLVLDLSAVRHFDSSGIGALVEAFEEAEKRHVRLILSDLDQPLRRVLDRTGLSNMFEIARTAEEALM